MGIKNEWLLGVSTDSIDVLEATYNEETRDHIYQQALNQQEIEKFYREKIDNKELIYCISLTPKMGNFFINTLLSEISIMKYSHILWDL